MNKLTIERLQLINDYQAGITNIPPKEVVSVIRGFLRSGVGPEHISLIYPSITISELQQIQKKLKYN
ncbi:MAG TPA: hypothetical protein VJ279_11215 [Hanamia sp.]|jgi:hypothetical protein|nr:hypothetical protein [Hanamia sp.]